MTLDNFLIDKRVVQRNIERGRVSAEQYAEMLRSLPDLSGVLWRRPEPSEAAHPAAPPPAVSEAAASAAWSESGTINAPQPWLPG